MHCLVIAVTDEKPEAGTLEELLAPYGNGDEWDWWAKGGRWTGWLDDYDPTKDPANIEPCAWCEATGTTTQAVADRFPAYLENVGKTCRQCKGDGKSVKWPTQWVEHDGDSQPAAAVLAKIKERAAQELPIIPPAFVTDEYGWVRQESHMRNVSAVNEILGRPFDPSKVFPPVEGYEAAWVKVVEDAAAKGWWLTVVDCHN